MALGLSGSNGGVREAYKRFVIADVEAGISKYKSLADSLPKEDKKVRTLYFGVVESLEKIREEMAGGLEEAV